MAGTKGIYMQKISNTGAFVGGETLVNTEQISDD
jgi:hypothetical protein